MNTGRRPEGCEPHEHTAPEDARHVATCCEPGRIYKLTLYGGILDWRGESGSSDKFNRVHGIACRSEETLYAADLNNRHVQKLPLDPRGNSTGQ